MANELPSAFVSHRAPGRVRVRIPAMRHQDDYFERLRAQLASVPGMRRLTTNTRTASVLIEFTGEIEALAQLGQRLELFDLGHRPHPHSVTEFLHVLTSQPDRILKRVTDGRVDMAGLTALALTGMGISQIVRGHALPAGWTLLWNATNLVRDVGKVGHDTGE
ncbi:MAG: HMA2 domain-containing protein [Polyangiales bacterium]